MMVLNRFRNFDVYAKPVDDCRVKTSFGGLITMVSFIVITILFINEVIAYFSVEVADQLFVDSTSSEMKVDIHFDITFPRLPCAFVTVDVMGVSGDNQDAIEDDVLKQQLDADGNVIAGSSPEKQKINSKKPQEKNASTEHHSIDKTHMCGSCYGAIDGCCNTCEEVREAYRIRGWQIDGITKIEQCKTDDLVRKFEETKGQGCRVYGHADVGKVGGNLHIAPGHPRSEQGSHFHDFQSLTPFSFDASHIFNHLSFGKPFPGKVYPLDGKRFVTDKGGIMYQYYLKVVPTNYVYTITDNGREELSYQFSITRKERDVAAGAGGIPGLFLIYEFSPLMVRYQERQKSFTNFAVSVCAIIGGVFTVASLLDSFIYSGSRAVQRKFQMGKAN